MNDSGPAAAIGAAAAVGGGVGVADVVGGGIFDAGGGGAVTDVATSSGVGMADVASAAGGAGAGLLGFFYDIGGLVSHIGAFLGQLAVGLVIGGGIVGGGFLLLALLTVVIEVRARRGEQVLRPPVTTGESLTALTRPPRTLRWVHVLLPGDEGAAWVAEVTSCLAEAQNENERRRHIRGYRHAVPRLLWTSWAVHIRGSRSRMLS